MENNGERCFAHVPSQIVIHNPILGTPAFLT